MLDSSDETLPDTAFLIRDNTTGVVYDVRKTEAAVIIKEEHKKLTTLSPSKKDAAWTEWWKEKREMNAALITASEEGNLALVRELLDISKTRDLSPDINAKGLDDFTPLHQAVSEEHTGIVKFLLSNNCLVDPSSVSLRTPLHLACCRGNVGIITLLLEYKADVNGKDKDGNTPAHILAEVGRVEPLTALLKYNPDLTLKNMYGETPADVAVTVECRELLQCKDKNLSQGYTRTVVDNLILHNNRADMVKSLMFKSHLLATSAIPRPPPSEPLVKRKADPVAKTQPRGVYRGMKKEIDIISTTSKSPVKPEDFVPIQLLGKGSFGEVYLAKYKETGKYYAIKILSKKQLSSHNLMKYAKAERNILTYSKHPFIVGIEFAFQNPESLFLVLEYCPGGDLAEVLHMEKKFSESRARIYAAEILLALEALHHKNIIFRDLKPGNVVLDADGHALLTDFGLSKEGVGQDLTKSFCGTAAYMAPEVLKKTGYGRVVDWYVFGAFIYEMLIGVPPYYARNRKELFENITSAPLKFPSYISKEAKDLLEKLLERDPTKRLGSGGEDSEDIKRHPWFKAVDWSVVISKGLIPPKPVFKKIHPTEIPIKKFYSGKKGQNEVKGWSFVLH